MAFHYSLQITVTLSSHSCNNAQEDTETACGDLNINHLRTYYLATLLRTSEDKLHTRQATRMGPHRIVRDDLLTLAG